MQSPQTKVKCTKSRKTKSTGTGDNNAKVLYLNIIIYVFVWQLCCICCWRECLFPKSFFFICRYMFFFRVPSASFLHDPHYSRFPFFLHFSTSCLLFSAALFGSLNSCSADLFWLLCRCRRRCFHRRLCIGGQNKSQLLFSRFFRGFVCVFAFWKFSLKFKVSRITHTSKRHTAHTDTRFSLFAHTHHTRRHTDSETYAYQAISHCRTKCMFI